MPIIWYSIGAVAFALGVIGVMLPIVPTVPFLLIAVWAFARSSPQLHQKILSHRIYGPPIRAWQEHGAIGRVAKIWAVSAMAAGVVIALWMGLPAWLIAGQTIICLSVALYVVTRPESRF